MSSHSQIDPAWAEATACLVGDVDKCQGLGDTWECAHPSTPTTEESRTPRPGSWLLAPGWGSHVCQPLHSSPFAVWLARLCGLITQAPAAQVPRVRSYCVCPWRAPPHPKRGLLHCICPVGGCHQGLAGMVSFMLAVDAGSREEWGMDCGEGRTHAGPARLGIQSWTGAGSGRGSGQAGGHGGRCVAVGPRPWHGECPFSESPWGRGMSATGQFLISIL